MAAAARPGSPDVRGVRDAREARDARDARDGREARDVRVPCPLCGGLIHPIAGKCKHCKAELAGYRTVRPAANAPLPALSQASAAAPAGQPAHAPTAHAVPLPRAAQAVLPPRPADAPSPVLAQRAAWRSWPVVVIVVATMAIVAAVVLMVWPAGRSPGGKRVLQPPPAPERMDTQSPAIPPKIDLPPPAQAAPPQAPAPQAPAPQDPWSAPQPDPAPHAGTGPADPVDPDDDPSPDAADLLGPPQRSQAPGRRALSLNMGGNGMLAITARVCQKLDQCGRRDAVIQGTCDVIAQLPPAPLSGCPAAARCLRAIDALSCNPQSDAMQVVRLVLGLSDCADAAHC